MINSFVSDDSLSENIHNWFKTGGGYYSWKTINYFLYEYELHLKDKVKAERFKIDWDIFSREKFTSDYNSIEHIYPQKAKDQTWKQTFEGYTVTQRRLLRNSLGNLLALSSPRNASLGNKPFLEKKGNDLLKTGYLFGSYSENEVALSNDWDANSIFERGIKLLNFMEERWSIKIGDKDAKKKALGLSFLKTK